jgi:hypothetical protein
VPTPLGAFDAILCEPANVLAAAPPLVVQVRRGVLTDEVLSHLEAVMLDLRGRLLRGGKPMGFVAVLEATAAVANDEVRARQRRVIESWMGGVDARIAAMVVGDGLTPMLQRTVARGVMFGDPRVRVTKTTDEAAAWIAPHLGAATAEVASAIERARALR